MSPREIAALFRRHLAALGCVLVLAAGLGYHFEHAKPVYADTGTVTFTAPARSADLFAFGQSLLVIDEVMAKYMMSLDAQRQVRAAGGVEAYDVELVNLNNEEYPNYSDPYATLATTSPDPVAAQSTFAAVTQVLVNDLAARQAAEGVRPSYRIQALTIAAAGPIAQTGSRKRSLAGLALLTVIAAYLVSAILDRHPIRLRGLPRRRYRLDSGDRDWPAARPRPRAG